MRLKLTVEVWHRGDWYLARCPELDFVSQGTTPDEARQNLLEVIQIQFEEMSALGTLDDYLAEHGYKRDDGILIPSSEMVGLEKSVFQVA